MSKNTKLFLTFLILITFLAWFIVELTISDTLDDSNIIGLYNSQPSKDSTAEKFWKVITLSFSYGVPAWIVFLLLIARNKIQAIKLAIHFFAGVTISDYLKMLYSRKRPFMLSDIIFPGDCPQDFGMPSGHSLLGILFVVMYYRLFLHKWLENKRVLKYSLLVLVTVWGFLIGISRIPLAAHSYAQVIAGWFFGSLYLYVGILYVDPLLDRMFSRLLRSNDKKKDFILISIAFMSFLGVTCLIFGVRRIHSNYYSDYQHIINQCLRAININSTFYEAHFYEACYFSVVFGFFYGILFTKRLPETQVEETSFMRIVSKALILLILIAIPLVGFYLIPINVRIPWINFFFITMPQFLLAGIFYSLLGPIILNKCQLALKNEYKPMDDQVDKSEAYRP